MPPKRQPIRNFKGGTPNQISIDHTRRNPTIKLLKLVMLPIFGLNVAPNAHPVRNVNRDLRLVPLATHRSGREGCQPDKILIVAESFINLTMRRL